MFHCFFYSGCYSLYLTELVYKNKSNHYNTHTHTHSCLTALFPGLPRWAGTRKVKPVWILLKQETVSGSGVSWAVCKSAPCSRQTTMPAPHRSVFYRPDALPAAQPTVSKHWRHYTTTHHYNKKITNHLDNFKDNKHSRLSWFQRLRWNNVSMLAQVHTYTFNMCCS